MEGREFSGPFIQYVIFGVDNRWRSVERGRRGAALSDFEEAINNSGVRTYCYSLVGLKAGSDLLLWRVSDSIDKLQESYSSLMRSKLGEYLLVRYILTGMVRPSIYVPRHTQQDQGMLLDERKRYLIVYPFTKSHEWYLLHRDARQGIMNEHIKVGREYQGVRQLLAYSFGIDDQDFIVAYETDDLKAFQDLVMALRETEARRYTIRDTPIFLAIHRPLSEALGLL